MTFDELELKLIRLMSFPLKSQIKIDFDMGKQIFLLSVALYRSGTEVPPSLRKYVQAREGMTFRPHKTSYRLENEVVTLIQEVPCERGYQQTLRQQTLQFWQMAKSCHQMLMEIAAEDKFSKSS